MLIINVGVIDTGANGQTFLVQLFTVLAEQSVEQLRILYKAYRLISGLSRISCFLLAWPTDFFVSV